MKKMKMLLKSDKKDLLTPFYPNFKDGGGPLKFRNFHLKLGKMSNVFKLNGGSNIHWSDRER